MSKKSESPYGVAFLIRLGVLLALLLVVGGGLAYDRLVLVPSGEAAVKKVLGVCKNAGADRSGVHAAAGRGPNETETIGKYEVEHWEFGRILPNLEGHKVSVAFEGSKVVEVYSDGGIKAEDRSRLERASAN